MNILILTGKFGMGHWSASQSLRQQLLRAFPGAEVEVLDFVAEAMPNASVSTALPPAAMTQSVTWPTKGLAVRPEYPSEPPHFNPMRSLDRGACSRRNPRAFSAKPFRISNPSASSSSASWQLRKAMLSRWKGETGSALPLITCVTDLSSHSEWIHKYTDCYLVGSNDIRSRLAAKGVDRDIICVTGIPVRCEFKRPVRRRPGRERNLLIMGGGLGLLPKRDSFYEALDALPGVHTTIITGNNRKLYDRLAGKYAHIEVLGFTDRVYDYMARADLVLTKPGGITLFETIFSELPILAWEPFLEQEKNNARFLVKRGLGRVAAKEPEECLSAIRALIYDDETLEWMAGNMRAMKGQLEEESLNRMLAGLEAEKGVRVG